ncbi:unnamed protein product [Didymodactylos carnosus]|uniref:Uncharacterized protein n=1 Tax=Didymodactylos carnosus TaxID=1234261 RepID=A0A815E5R9_9BILA|nr:unnamed protein product [Didymodactylos carnosus]CAF1310294.1 unnamed protein product [Didymodactylos carnosus]CAF3666203.1 unnamed protein product [Didymodactylos carnosus]CAF4147075.1 unnamed protein product [Didymodactylos carnosus]
MAFDNNAHHDFNAGVTTTTATFSVIKVANATSESGANVGAVVSIDKLMVKSCPPSTIVTDYPNGFNAVLVVLLSCLLALIFLLILLYYLGKHRLRYLAREDEKILLPTTVIEKNPTQTTSIINEIDRTVKTSSYHENAPSLLSKHDSNPFRENSFSNVQITNGQILDGTNNTQYVGEDLDTNKASELHLLQHEHH